MGSVNETRNSAGKGFYAFDRIRYTLNPTYGVAYTITVPKLKPLKVTMKDITNKFGREVEIVSKIDSK